MHVVHAHALVEQVVRKILRHALGERGHEHALTLGSAHLDLVHEVVYLATHRAQLDLGVQQARRPDDLLDLLLAHCLLVVTGRRRNVDELRYALLELIKAQGTVVERRRQTKAMVDKGYLARAIALIHTTHLRHSDVALVNDAEHVLGKVVDERVGRLAGVPAVQVTRVVLDAGAVSHGLEHLEVISGALRETLSLEDHVVRLKFGHASFELFLDGRDRVVNLGPLGHVVRGRPDGDGIELAHDLARDVVHLGDELDLVAKEADAQGVLCIRGEHVHGVAPHTEGPSREVIVVAIVLDVNELTNEIVTLKWLRLVHVGSKSRIVLRAADAVDAAYGGDHDHVAAREQTRRGLVAQLLDLLVYGGVLLDVGVRLRNIGLGLVVIVVAHKVHDGIVGKELPHLGSHLRGQRLVGLHDECGLLHALYGLGHREGLARARDTQKRLVAKPPANALREPLDGLGLIAGRLEVRDDLKSLVTVLQAKALELGTVALLGLGRTCQGLVAYGMTVLRHKRAQTPLTCRHATIYHHVLRHRIRHAPVAASSTITFQLQCTPCARTSREVQGALPHTIDGSFRILVRGYFQTTLRMGRHDG